MAIDASFYKNVFLLMQLVPASYECTILFKKGMFDKPNTSGFIHISHYLLSIYNAKQFKKMVAWPIMNKMDEKKYRVEVKEYLEIVANENQDINFPTVLMTHLLQAGGTKFLITMWKLSQISLRSYITKHCQKEVLQAPSIGNNIDVVELYLSTINLKQNIIISKFYEKTKVISERFKYYMKCKSNDLTKMRTNIFEIKESLVNFVPVLPVNSLVAMQLIDIENTEVIKLWKENINEKIKYLSKKNLELKRVKDLSNMLCVLSMSSHSKSFDCGSLPKVSNDIIPLYSADGIQHLNYGLYMNGNLVFHNLLLILNQIFNQLYFCLKMTYLIDFSSHEPKITEHCKTMKFQETKFQKLLIQISDILCNVQCNLQEKTFNCTFETGVLFPIDSEQILTSPKFNFFNSEYIDDEKQFKQLWCSPIQGKYKNLFSRYKRFFNSFKSQFDDSIDNIALNWKSPRGLSLSNRSNSFNRIKVSPRYSRLFSSSNLKTTYFKDNNAASTPKLSRIQTTPKKSAIQTPSAEININLAIKNIFDLSHKLKEVVASLPK
nr:PREDICTED: uncharacterized protein LOC105661954 isoform X1 [Megachile rotundata]